MFKITLTRLHDSYNFLFISLIILSIIIYIYSLYSFSVIDQKLTSQYKKYLGPLMLNKKTQENDEESFEKVESAKSVINILMWTNPTVPPFNYLKTGRQTFVDNKCKFNNCYITDDREYLEYITDFDAIIFNGKNFIDLKPEELPQQRSQKQKYIFASTETPHFYPVCCESFDSYFNWTFTYRINSDFRWGYVTVYDLEDNIVGPKIDMTWPEHMDPVTADVVEILKTKSKAAVWFVSNCELVISGRHLIVRQLLDQLQKYKLSIDIYGKCGPFKCAKSSPQVCFEKVKKDYYFYLAFENSFGEDYVTEKLTDALNNYAVPIVFGAANYSRFLPPGSYLHAYELGAERLAKTINTIINNRTMYHEFFRWRNHFKYKYTLENDDVCKLCEVLNDKQKINNVTIVNNLRAWWNGPLADNTCRKFLKRRKCPSS